MERLTDCVQVWYHIRRTNRPAVCGQMPSDGRGRHSQTGRGRFDAAPCAARQAHRACRYGAVRVAAFCAGVAEWQTRWS
ncbi:hypothetical protein B5F11_18340 [Anaerotruncus colihominis]|uniref:Uncharacterized protein n=1 Tax=Anaerotruncus colihominis TaxID=169435 RepID=A0A1Y4MIS2_9FIRM|nr:hypothetical protein B5F11_18340 [Anaerotruncus colihominis]